MLETHFGATLGTPRRRMSARKRMSGGRIAAVAGSMMLLAASTSPSLGASPGTTSPGDPNVDTIAASIDALQRLSSYGYLWRLSMADDPERVSIVEGTIISGPEPRTRTDDLVGDEVQKSIVTIGSTGWQSAFGSGYAESDAVTPRDGDKPRYERAIREALETVTSVADLGVETIDGVPATHLRATFERPDPTSAPDPGDQPYRNGTLDIWIAQDRGYLVRSVLDGQQIGYDRRTNGRYRTAVSETVTIERVDDPGNVIDIPPGLMSPPPVSAADPAVVALIDAAYAGLTDLGSYRASNDGLGLQYDLIIQYRPVHASQTTIVAGDFSSMHLVVGDRTWSRDTADQPWRVTGPDPARTCPAADGTLEACVFLSEARYATEHGAAPGSFVRLADEVLDGAPVAHLRSEAGEMDQQLGWIPGTTDIWIALDGGLLVREVVDGQGREHTMTISHLNDPANLLEAPDTDG
jgi:hypothetical protein